MATFREDWTPEQISRFWDHYATSDAPDESYFSSRFGSGIVGLGRRHGMFAPGSSVLDYGCGRGYLVRHLLETDCQVSGFDSSAASVDRANSLIGHHPNWKGAATSVPRGPFDAAVCIETVEHLDDDALSAVLGQLRSVLKAGGSALFTTPNEERLADNLCYCPFCDSEFHNMQHVRSWSARSLRERLDAEGFRIRVCEAVHLDAQAPFHWPDRWNRQSLRRALRPARRLGIVGTPKPHLCAIAER